MRHKTKSIIIIISLLSHLQRLLAWPNFVTRLGVSLPASSLHATALSAFSLLIDIGSFFNKYDQELAVTFSMYCGISIYHVSRLESSQLHHF